MERFLKVLFIWSVFAITIGFAVDSVSPSRPRTIFTQTPYYEVMFKNSPVCQAFVSEDGDFLAINGAFSKYLGFTETELLKTNFQAITHPSDVEADSSMSKKVSQGELEGYTILKTYLGKYDTALRTRLTVQAIRDEDGNFKHFYSIVEPLLSKNLAPASYSESIPPMNIKVLSFFNDNWNTLIPWAVIIYLYLSKFGAKWILLNKWYKKENSRGKDS
tara:strand:+ start:38713 stop:39366 length:654 start_codon:yes stop_codon:yes gene_type:complete